MYIRYSPRRVSIHERNLKLVSKTTAARPRIASHPAPIYTSNAYTTARLTHRRHQPPQTLRVHPSRLLSDETTSDADSARQATDKGTDRYRASRPRSSRGRALPPTPPPLDSVARCSPSLDATTPHNSLSQSAAANPSFLAPCPAQLFPHCHSLPPPIAAHRRLAICPSSAPRRPSPPPSSSCLGLPPSSRRS